MMVETGLCFNRVYAKKKWPESWADKLDEFNYKHFVNPYTFR